MENSKGWEPSTSWSYLKNYYALEKKYNNLSSKEIRVKIRHACDRMRILSEILAQKECEETSKIPPDSPPPNPSVLKRSPPLAISDEDD